MGQFKPMVKMMTDEPSVILKLKKGGKVASKAAGQSEGFKSMASNNAKVFEDAESGKSPKKPSVAERRRSMNPNFYAKGGKVANKQVGGVMPVAAPGAVPGAAAVAPAPMRAMGRDALMAMPAAKRAARAAMVRKAMTGMKKGGSACAALEKELKHHESMSASKAHSKASGGKIDSAETKTTLKNSVKPFAKTKMDKTKKDKAHGTGEVKEGKPGGYKMGGTIEGNEKQFENTKMVKAKVDRAHGTGGIKESNAGGYATGGSIPAATNKGVKEGHFKKGTVEGGDWENRSADTSKPGIKGGTTGGVKEANAGGYKKGGSAKKAFATGGNVVSDGKAVKMPRHFVSRPVANSLQSGTFKKGGKVKFAEGGSEDMSKGAYDRHYANEKAENEADRKLITSIPKKLYEGAKSLFSSKPPEGSVTKTEKSVTVSPRKRGGLAKC